MVQDLDERVGVGPADLVRLARRSRDPQRADEALRHLLDRDGLEPVAAVAEHGHHRQRADHARQHGHELVAAAEDDRTGRKIVQAARWRAPPPRRPTWSGDSASARRRARPARSCAGSAARPSRLRDAGACSPSRGRGARSKVTPRARCSRMMPTRWMTAAQPSTAALERLGRSTSPGERSMASKPLRSRFGAAADQAAHGPGSPRRGARGSRTCRRSPCRRSRRCAASARNRSMDQSAGASAPACSVSWGPCARSWPSGRRSSAALLSWPWPALAGAARAARAAPDLSALDDAARDAFNAGEVPGAVILVGQGDRVLYRKAFGIAQPGARPGPDDPGHDLRRRLAHQGRWRRCPPCSRSWSDGKVSLDAPLGRYLQEFGGPAFREVTVRRLLTHSAGLPRPAVARRDSPRLPRGGAAAGPRRSALQPGLDLPLQRHRLHPARRAGAARERRAARPVHRAGASTGRSG